MKQRRKTLICTGLIFMITAMCMMPAAMAWQQMPYQDDGAVGERQEGTGASHFKKHLPVMVDLSRKVKIMLTILAVVMLYIIMRFMFYRLMIQQFDTRPQTALAIHYSMFFLLSFVVIVLMFSESFAFYMVYILGGAWVVLTILAAALL